MKHLVGKVHTKKIKFLGSDVEIKKLSVEQVLELQEIMKNPPKGADELYAVRQVLRAGVVGSEELTDEDFNTFSPVDLNFLAEQVLKLCGLLEADKAGN